MKNITFTQREYKKSFILMVSYLTALIIITYAIWRWNFGIKDFINTHFSGSIPRWFVAITCLSPLLYLIKLTIRDIYITIGIDKITIDDKKIIEIPIKDIDYITVNEPRDATINLYSTKGLLYTFDGYYEEEEILDELEQKIVEKGDFDRKDKTKKIISTIIHTRRYTKK